MSRMSGLKSTLILWHVHMWQKTEKCGQPLAWQCRLCSLRCTEPAARATIHLHLLHIDVVLCRLPQVEVVPQQLHDHLAILLLLHVEVDELWDG